MVRGTTPSHIFNLPFQTTNITDAYITYKQDGTLVLEKEKGGSGVTMSGSEITIALTQAETLSFTSGINVEIQVALDVGSYSKANTETFSATQETRTFTLQTQDDFVISEVKLGDTVLELDTDYTYNSTTKVLTLLSTVTETGTLTVKENVYVPKVFRSQIITINSERILKDEAI